jgi:hypothetical protein
MIKIDFYGSTHGHFLEYVTNVYVMQTAPSKASIFKPPTYSAHSPDKFYLKDRIITCGHFSDYRYNVPIHCQDSVIRINLDQTNDNMFFIALTNLMYKGGDVGFEKQQLNIPDSIRNNPISFRNNWYSKFNEKELYIDHYGKFSNIDNPVYEFNFSSFFSFKEFCVELANIATFLEQTFYPDQSLYNLWNNFIQVNQGWQSYIKCNHLINCIFSNIAADIDCTIIEQGWLNYHLSKICRMFDGPMFDQEEYPANTITVYKIVQDHLDKMG